MLNAAPDGRPHTRLNCNLLRYLRIADGTVVPPGESFLADRTNGRAIATLLRLSSVCL